MKPVVSIIIPCYNAECWVGEALQSCFVQTYPPREIIVVDDGSTDQSKEVILATAGKSNIPVKLIEGNHSGACAARNIGWNEAKGDYLQFLDADDLLSPRKIEFQAAVASRNPETVTYGSWLWLKQTDGHWEKVLGQPPIANDPLGEILKGNFFVTHCFLWPRQILLKLGGWDAMLASWQDIDLVFRAVLDGAPFEFVPGSEVYHRVGHNDASVSSVRTLESLKSRIRVLERVLKELDRRGELEKYRKLIADRFYWLARQFASHQSSEAENCFRRFLELSPDGHVPGPARRIRSLLQANRFERAHGN